MVLHLPITQECFVSSFVEFGTAVLKKKFLNTFNIILQFYCLLFQKGVALHLNQFTLSLHRETLSQVWMKLAKWFWKRVLKYFQFYYLTIISH